MEHYFENKMISRDAIYKAVFYLYNCYKSGGEIDGIEFLQPVFSPLKVYSIEYGSRNGTMIKSSEPPCLLIGLSCDYQRELYETLRTVLKSLQFPPYITVIPWQPADPKIYETYMELLDGIQLVPVPSFEEIPTLSARVKNLTPELISIMILALDEYDVLTSLGTFSNHPDNSENNNFISFHEFKTMLKEKYRPPLKVCRVCGFSSIQVDLNMENNIYKCQYPCK